MFHGSRLMTQHDYFRVFKLALKQVPFSRGSCENWLKSEIEQPQADLALQIHENNTVEENINNSNYINWKFILQ